MRTSHSNAGHSAVVPMRLHVSGRTFRIAQMGPDFVFVTSPADIPPTRATIELRVDASHRTWEVNPPEGIKAGEERVRLAAVA